jgi:hypothetical protein
MGTVRRRLSAAVAASACALAACYAPPDDSDRRTAIGKVQQVFASDLSTAGFAQRSAGWSQAVDSVPEEIGRAGRLDDRVGALTDRAGPRIDSLTQDLATAAQSEAARVQHLQLPDPVAAGPDRATARFAAALADLPTIFGLDRRPLGEPSDREHRTDPNDNRPEATLWQRLARRLGL